MNINQKIQEFLTEHQYQKKRRIFTAVLSLMIVFSVVSSLIMPAISNDHAGFGRCSSSGYH